SPRLRGKFLILDPERVPRRLYGKAASISGAFQLGEEADLEELPRVDLLVCGSVAVTLRGERIGKGGGYSELEYAILRELGLAGDETPIVTSVHELQIVEYIPLEAHDFTVDYIATPERILRTKGERRRPKGIIWEELTEEEINEMPLIRKLRHNKVSNITCLFSM
ncbi:MAG: 5-formyltetrahydrofolate cyclo-ligase, partial [Candidatus Bathyarchaeia archaeon]